MSGGKKDDSNDLERQVRSFMWDLQGKDKFNEASLVKEAYQSMVSSRHTITSLQAENKELRERGSDWVLLSDRLPVDLSWVTKFDSKTILIVTGGQVEVCEFTYGPKPEPWCKFDDFHKAFISHWAELPEPPK